MDAQLAAMECGDPDCSEICGPRKQSHERQWNVRTDRSAMHDPGPQRNVWSRTAMERVFTDRSKMHGPGPYRCSHDPGPRCCLWSTPWNVWLRTVVVIVVMDRNGKC